MSVTFKLECVGCRMKEERPAEKMERDDVPYCSKCYMPMIVKSVIYHSGRKPKGPRTVVSRGEIRQ